MHKFFAGDLVRIADDLGPTMSHFPRGQDAIVLYSYSMNCTPSVAGDKEFFLYCLKSKEECGWFHEKQLTFKEEYRFDLLPKSNPYRKVVDEQIARREKMEKNNG